MFNDIDLAQIKTHGRVVEPARAGDPKLGALSLLPGTWKNQNGLEHHGWNMIALPFEDGPFHFRLLLLQYDEELVFSIVDKGVPNRGVRQNGMTIETDQFLAALDYDQKITQFEVADFPVSGLAAANGTVIHREPGLWLNIGNLADGFDLARLATIPHGESVMALGKARTLDGAPTIPTINGLPLGVAPDLLNNPFLGAYRHFHDNLFQGVFDPTNPSHLLEKANAGVNIFRTTELAVDTTILTGGIHNIPFVTKQAKAAEMKATFWIQELDQRDAAGDRVLRLQYLQVVLLEFFPRPDGAPGLIRWPHISINTLTKV